MQIEIVSGNDIAEKLQLKKNGVVFNIPIGATVKAVLVSRDQTIVYAGPFMLLSTDEGAVWASSMVSLIVADTLTGGLKPANAKIEVQVDDVDKESWFFDAKIVKGNVV